MSIRVMKFQVFQIANATSNWYSFFLPASSKLNWPWVVFTIEYFLGKIERTEMVKQLWKFWSEYNWSLEFNEMGHD